MEVNSIKRESVADQIFGQLKAKIMDKLMLYAFLDQRSLAEISEFRDILEPAVTRLACQRANTCGPYKDRSPFPFLPSV